jgi:predicted NACHT family NTPase
MPELLMNVRSAVVEGTAGSGKSMFMRYLFLQLCKNPNGKLPLFVELRQLNSFQVKDLLAFVYHTILSPGAVLTRAQFDSSLKHGLFTIIFDGFDEIDFDQRKEIEQQILAMRERYPEVPIIMSSRPRHGPS